jgi:hypothetical protein
MLRITIGSVSPSILHMRIPSLTLDPTEQYTVLSAVDEIRITADLYAKERGLPFGLTPFVIDHLVSGPIPGAPHLPESMHNITLDEAQLRRERDQFSEYCRDVIPRRRDVK